MIYEGVLQKSTLKGNHANMILSEMSNPIQRSVMYPESLSDGDIPSQLKSSASLCIPETFSRRYSAGGTTDGSSRVTANTELSRHSRASLQAEGVAPAKPC